MVRVSLPSYNNNTMETRGTTPGEGAISSPQMLPKVEKSGNDDIFSHLNYLPDHFGFSLCRFFSNVLGDTDLISNVVCYVVVSDAPHTAMKVFFFGLNSTK